MSASAAAVSDFLSPIPSLKSCLAVRRHGAHALPPVHARRPPAAAMVSPTTPPDSCLCSSASSHAQPAQRRLGCVHPDPEVNAGSVHPAPNHHLDLELRPLRCIANYAAASFSSNTTEREERLGEESLRRTTPATGNSRGRHLQRLPVWCSTKFSGEVISRCLCRSNEGVFRGGPRGVMKELFLEDHGEAAVSVVSDRQRRQVLRFLDFHHVSRILEKYQTNSGKIQ